MSQNFRKIDLSSHYSLSNNKNGGGQEYMMSQQQQQPSNIGNAIQSASIYNIPQSQHMMHTQQMMQPQYFQNQFHQTPHKFNLNENHEKPHLINSIQSSAFKLNNGVIMKDQSMNYGKPSPVQSNNAKLFYENRIPARVRSKDREDYITNLIFTILIGTVGPHNSTYLHLEITDENDFFFLYTLECGETEFHAIKNEQSLLIDFQQFPYKLIELFDMCMNNEESQRFVCLLSLGNTNEAMLSIIETNQFKQLSHLSLRYKQGNDDNVKKFLANKLRESKVLNEENKCKIENLESSNIDIMKKLDKTLSELNLASEENRRIVDLLKLEEQKKINQMNEKSIEERLESQRKYEDEMNLVKNAADLKIRELENKINELQLSVGDLKELKQMLEVSERELKSKLNSTSHELDLAKNELTQLRGANKVLDTTKYAQDKSITEYTLKNQNLISQLEDKEEIISKMTNLLESTKEQKIQLEESLNIYKGNNTKMEDKLQGSAQEIIKGNSIIQKLQSELKSQKQKLKLKNTVVLQQEQVIQQKQDAIDEHIKNSNEKKREVEKKEDEVQSLKSTMNDLKTKLDDSQKTLESNHQMIQWLNKSLSEAQKQTAKSYMSSTKPPLSTTAVTSFRPTYTSVDKLNIDNTAGISATTDMGKENLYSKYNQTGPYQPYHTNRLSGYNNSASFGGYKPEILQQYDTKSNDLADTLNLVENNTLKRTNSTDFLTGMTANMQGRGGNSSIYKKAEEYGSNDEILPIKYMQPSKY